MESRLNINTSSSTHAVVYISPHGIWLFVDGKEYFLPSKEFPRFQDARVADVQDVLLTNNRVMWPHLDFNIELGSLDNLEKFPRVYYDE